MLKKKEREIKMSEPLSPLPFVDLCAPIHSAWQNHLSRDGIYRNVTDNALSFKRVEFIDATLLSKWGLTLEDINAIGTASLEEVYIQAQELSGAKKAFIKETSKQIDAALASAASYTTTPLDLPSNAPTRRTYGDLTPVKLYPLEIKQPSPTCTHEWKEYVGFTSRFDYCTKCDEKKK